MLILTTPEILYYDPSISRISKILHYFETYIVVEVDDSFELDEDTMLNYDIDFYWEVSDGYIDASIWDFSAKYPDGGFPEAVMNIYNLSNPKNIAICLYCVSRYIDIDPIDLWNNIIE